MGGVPEGGVVVERGEVDARIIQSEMGLLPSNSRGNTIKNGGNIGLRS